MDEELELGGRSWSPRSRLIAGCVAAVVVIATLVAVVASRPAGTDCRVVRCVPAWALPWPDHRDGSVPQRVLEGAVLAFRHRAGQPGWDGNGPQVLPPPKAVVWYAGQVIARGRLVVVVFEADSQEGRSLVTGYAQADKVMQGQPGWQSDTPGFSESPWVLSSAPAPAPRPGVVVGINAAVPSDSAPGQPATDPLSGDWVIQLASPDVTAMSWRAPAGWPPASRPVRAAAPRGMAVAHAGSVTGTITLASLTVGRRHVREEAPVGLPGNADSTIPELTPPTSTRTGWDTSGSGQGQSGINLGAGRSVITMICYGPSPVTVRLSSTGPDLTLGRIPCDDQPHSLTRTGRPADISWDASQLTAWNVQIAGPAATSPPS